MNDDKKNSPLNQDATKVILDSISDGVFTIDYNWKITSFNRAAEKITGIPKDEAMGRHCWDVFRSNMCEPGCALKRTMEEGKSFVSSSAYIINSNRKRIPIEASTSLLVDDNGEVLGGVEVFRDLSTEEALRKEISSRFHMGDMVSRSSSMKEIFNILPRISESDTTVLVEGETGTGKELTAKAVHNLSFRKEKPFMAVNCGALPDTLLESELFGHKAGAFTSAVKDKPGLFAQACGGTIFLDEIGDTTPAFQVRLLRVLQDQEFQPLGGTKKEKTDVRIITATNRNLSEMVDKKEFRQDLYYRINVMKIRLPPLRDRLEDIPLLADRFITRLNRVRNKAVQGLDHDVLAILMKHDYPGNIRELENIIEHAFVLCSKGNIKPEHLPAQITAKPAVPSPAGNSETETGTDPVRQAETRLLIDALKRCNYNRKKAAESLGIHKSTLYRRIKRLGIDLAGPE
ncbi:MAG: sigma 54-interacting transcriptional regulator [Desulfobacteraceae bacterium]